MLKFLINQEKKVHVQEFKELNKVIEVKQDLLISMNEKLYFYLF